MCVSISLTVVCVRTSSGLPVAERVDLLRTDVQQDEEREGGHEDVLSAEVLRLRGTFKHEDNQPPQR